MYDYRNTFVGPWYRRHDNIRIHRQYGNTCTGTHLWLQEHICRTLISSAWCGRMSAFIARMPCTVDPNLFPIFCNVSPGTTVKKKKREWAIIINVIIPNLLQCVSGHHWNIIMYGKNNYVWEYMHRNTFMITGTHLYVPNLLQCVSGHHWKKKRERGLLLLLLLLFPIFCNVSPGTTEKKKREGGLFVGTPSVTAVECVLVL